MNKLKSIQARTQLIIVSDNCSTSLFVTKLTYTILFLFLKMRQNWKETFWNLATFKIDIDSKLVKEEPVCDLNENSKVKEEEFDDFIENDDYIDDPDFDEDKPIKLKVR